MLLIAHLQFNKPLTREHDWWTVATIEWPESTNEDVKIDEVDELTTMEPQGLY